MAAATANRFGERQPSHLASYTGASGYHYYKDTLVIKPGVSLAAFIPLTRLGSSNGYFMGVASEEVDLTAGLGASQRILRIWKTGEFTFAANGTGSSWHIGLPAYGLDDQTVGVSIASQSIIVGEIVGVPTTSSYRVRIDAAIGNRGVSAEFTTLALPL